jgi:hypothetical protein
MLSINAFAIADPTPWFTISRNELSDVYLIKYTGSKTGKVTVSIKDSKGNEIITRSILAVRDFSMPINFSSVAEDIYTVQIDNGTEKVTQTLNYTNETAPTFSHVTNLGNKHYLFTASHAGLEKILIVITDGNGAIVFEENKVIKGDAAFLFDLTKVSGQPTFDVTEESGHSLMIPGSPQVIAVKK